VRNFFFVFENFNSSFCSFSVTVEQKNVSFPVGLLSLYLGGVVKTALFIEMKEKH
jgi:hypothetical protein